MSVQIKIMAGENLRDLRINLFKLSEIKMGKLLEVSRSTIIRMEAKSKLSKKESVWINQIVYEHKQKIEEILKKEGE